MRSPKVKPKHLNCRWWAAGGQKSCSSMLLDRTWGKLNTQRRCQNKFFPEVFWIVLGSSYHAEVCSSVNYSDRFVFNELFDAINRE